MELIVTTREQLRELLNEVLQTSLSNQKETPVKKAEIIDRDELCKRLNITEPTVIRWEKKKLIPRLEIGSAVRYDWNKVLNALETKTGGKKL